MQLRVNYSGEVMPVSDVNHAIKLIEALSESDLLDKDIKSNFFDLEVWEEINGEWSWNTWYDEETGNDILEIIKEASCK